MVTIDLIKVVAAQVIVWHHLVLYGPLARAARPQAEGLIDWLQRDGPAAVYAFLVIGGFLAASALIPEPTSTRGAASVGGLLAQVKARYLRLAPTYLVALACAVAAAAFARHRLGDPDTPAAPALEDLLAHVFLLQSLLDVPALSAGVWYVAADLLLFAMLATIAWAGRAMAARAGAQWGGVQWGGATVIGLVLLLAGLGWTVWCRNPALDDWPIYFFGAYGLGVIACWSRSALADSLRLPAGRGAAARWTWIAAILVLGAMALWPAIRPQTLVAVVVAMVLAGLPRRVGYPERAGHGRRAGVGVGASSRATTTRWPGRMRRWIIAASQRSYALFLIHYPVSLVTGTLFANWVLGEGRQVGQRSAIGVGIGIGAGTPIDAGEAAVVGLVVTWASCLMASDLLYRLVERAGSSRGRRLVPA